MDTHKKFMQCALRLANYSLHHEEVPVACVFVYNGQIVSHGMNSTNDSLSGTNHAEFQGIDVILSKVRADPCWELHFTKPEDIFKEIDLYVTVEPCIMCASALKQVGIRAVYFGCGNERFGGNGSVLKINSDITVPENNYSAFPGIYRKEAILLLRDFYTHENTKAPIPKNKKNRNLNTETFPEIIWSSYLGKQEFSEMYGEENLDCFQKNRDVFETIDLNLIDASNTHIVDILERTKSPLLLAKKRKLQEIKC